MVVTRQPYPITGSPTDVTCSADLDQRPAVVVWAAVEQRPDGGWWVTVADSTATTSTGPYLDEVQAERALHRSIPVVHTTNSGPPTGNPTDNHHIDERGA